uniref:Putative ovule protein n=1 Tax=Solanum chacoense TaxID=4108 RepID=A0A0V0HN41_SOLCH
MPDLYFFLSILGIFRLQNQQNCRSLGGTSSGLSYPFLMVLIINGRWHIHYKEKLMSKLYVM